MATLVERLHRVEVDSAEHTESGQVLAALQEELSGVRMAAAESAAAAAEGARVEHAALEQRGMAQVGVEEWHPSKPGERSHKYFEQLACDHR